MQERLTTYLKSVRLSEPQAFRNITVFPLRAPGEGSPGYITLGEALEQQRLVITELSQGGSVPELKVTNRTETPVLLLDGEELAGAKQNRVLNTSVLVPERKELVIPVSCTEHGRWHFTSAAFAESGTVMSPSLRARKSRSVSKSLRTTSTYRSDQHEVWDGIAELQEATGVRSGTSAMRDVYVARESALKEARTAFPVVEDQCGLLVAINGEAVGFDLLCRPETYRRLHEKLLQSYAMDALISKEAAPVAPQQATESAHRFMSQAMACEEEAFPSVGYGEDFRYKAGDMAGSALVYQDRVVHTAFFRLGSR